MEFAILGTEGDYGTVLASFPVPNATARENLDFALLQAGDQAQRLFGLDDAAWEALVGADFGTTGTSDLTNKQVAVGILGLVKVYMKELAAGGERQMIRNLRDADYVGVGIGDFGEVT